MAIIFTVISLLIVKMEISLSTIGLALGIRNSGCQSLVNPQTLIVKHAQRYVVKVPKSAGAGQYCPKIPRVPGTRGTRTNSSSAAIY